MSELKPVHDVMYVYEAFGFNEEENEELVNFITDLIFREPAVSMMIEKVWNRYDRLEKRVYAVFVLGRILQDAVYYLEKMLGETRGLGE